MSPYHHIGPPIPTPVDFRIYPQRLYFPLSSVRRPRLHSLIGPPRSLRRTINSNPPRIECRRKRRWHMHQVKNGLPAAVTPNAPRAAFTPRGIASTASHTHLTLGTRVLDDVRV
jgi:hypothetical protein